MQHLYVWPSWPLWLMIRQHRPAAWRECMLGTQHAAHITHHTTSALAAHMRKTAVHHSDTCCAVHACEAVCSLVIFDDTGLSSDICY